MSWCFQWSSMELGPQIFWRVFESDKIRSNRKSTKFGLGCLPLLWTARGQSRQHQLQDYHSCLWEQQQMAICSMAHGRGGREHGSLTKHDDSTNSTVCNPSSNKGSRSPWSSWDCCGGTLGSLLEVACNWRRGVVHSNVFLLTHKFSAVMKVALGYTWLDSLWIHCLICVLLEQVSWTNTAEEIPSMALTSVSAPWSRAFKVSMFVRSRRGSLSKASDFAWFRSTAVYWTIGKSV